ncbi:tRNA-specific 2-thiouridylase MnmA [Sporomusa ovata DSM 2662]|uniref:asparagine synthase (glutamine-hydrolyzing) n=1 Tax=Sporomusa ovata TaxID=2378 RepID=A0A0U1KS62_9FIRM|nr:asparagine synthase-related protein [Sporomusa ovata]EQB26193.1 asparagine synthase [Sporomusa ovata DSM 2662]CQR70266.1 hypothetical protein SpAn4DRAFT_1235 [Sporomusa ovata]
MNYYEDIYNEYDVISTTPTLDLQVKGMIWSSYTNQTKSLVHLLINKDKKKAAIELKQLFQNVGYSCLKDIDGAYVMGMRSMGTQYLYKSLLCKTSLYYRMIGHKLIWSTNPLKLLDDSKSALQQVDRASLLLTCLGESVLPDKSHFMDIYRLPAGHLLIFKAGKINHIRIDKLTVTNIVKKSAISDYADQTRQILHDTLKRRIGSLGKNIGVLLSGGIDSSVALYMLKEAGVNVSAYHWSFPNIKSADESYYARIVTNHLNVPLHEIDATFLIESSLYLKTDWEFQLPYNHSFYRLFEITRDLCLSNNINILSDGSLSDAFFSMRKSEFKQISFRALLKTLSMREAIIFTREKMGTVFCADQPKCCQNIFPRMLWYENYLTDSAKKSIQYYYKSVKPPTDPTNFFTDALIMKHMRFWNRIFLSLIG